MSDYCGKKKSTAPPFALSKYGKLFNWTIQMNLKFSQIIMLYKFSFVIKCTEQSINIPSKWTFFDNQNKTTRDSLKNEKLTTGKINDT